MLSEKQIGEITGIVDREIGERSRSEYQGLCIEYRGLCFALLGDRSILVPEVKRLRAEVAKLDELAGACRRSLGLLDDWRLKTSAVGLYPVSHALAYVALNLARALDAAGRP